MSKHVEVPGGARVLRQLIQGSQHIRGIPRLAYITRSLLLASDQPYQLVDTPDGLPITIDLNDYGQIMHFYFPYCPELRTLLDDVLQPGYTCIDLGANTGLLTMHMAEAVGDAGLVIAVDPNPGLIRQIQHTVDQCQVTNIRPLQAGISGAVGTARFAIPQGANSESGEIQTAGTGGIEVQLLTVDAVLQTAAGGQAVDFIKYDVEGVESHLIESLDAVFQRGERPILLVEFHPKKIAQYHVDPQAIRQQLWDLGYAERHVELHQNHYRLHEDKSPLTTNANILFMPPQRLESHPSSDLKHAWMKV
jgi:FkbM family methyltransferase